MAKKPKPLVLHPQPPSTAPKDVFVKCPVDGRPVSLREGICKHCGSIL
jgi:hypothetical protein